MQVFFFINISLFYFQAKLDRSSKTGAHGDPSSKLDIIDQLVIEIIGKTSPVLKGLGVADSFEQTEQLECQDAAASVQQSDSVNTDFLYQPAANTIQSNLPDTEGTSSTPSTQVLGCKIKHFCSLCKLTKKI